MHRKAYPFKLWHTDNEKHFWKASQWFVLDVHESLKSTVAVKCMLGVQFLVK